ncbi:MAG: transcription-repair coupling factor, partial [Armatimonadota bacterium]
LPRLGCMSFDELLERLAARPALYLNMLGKDIPWAEQALKVKLSTPPVDSFGGQMDLLADGIREWRRAGQRLVVASSRLESIREMFAHRDIRFDELDDGAAPAPGMVQCRASTLSAGFKLPAAELVVLTDSEIFGWHKLRRPKQRKFTPGITVTSLSELTPGCHVVHVNHGVGIYRGLVRQTILDVERDYLKIQYAGEDRLYVPVAQIDRVQKYIGSDGNPPTIHSLRGSQWQRQKRRVRRSARLLAKELLDLYASRQQAKGHAFSEDSPWLTEMEQGFKYEETPDQWRAIEDVKADMQRSIPTDRLVCGDVGYGKTEVAVRAAFKAVLEGKQVAVLVPTTVLAQQHYHTFCERLGAYPVNIEMLSRFRTRAAAQKVVAGLGAGTVDIVIGTHRLLQSDIGFRDLGLIVVDEEQRFGVRDKERLKQLKMNVDVITLTATPIPRTLHMSLSGIRDMSIINDPPAGRLPIITYAREHDDDVVKDAIVREIERGGQVYYVHNRVQSIKHVAGHLQRLLPSARIAIGHGQLPEDQLEQVMLEFYAGEYDVLLCTTIIESGLDIPNVNTIIIENAQNMGLAQLYQLRGRTGRSNRQAYAYLMYRYPERLTDEAEQRLQAIQEFAELGSGFKIALRDLEIRGSGNVLGPEQHGHMAAVGFDLYCRMLEEAIKSLRGEHVSEQPEVTVEIPVEAVVPAGYIADERQRVALYRRIIKVESAEHAEEVRRELQDRYGPLPEPVENLLRIAVIRRQARDVGIESIAAQWRKIVMRLRPGSRLSKREQRIFGATYRRGPLATGVPRADFRSNLISFGHAGLSTGQLFAAIRELIERLQFREGTPPDQGGAPVVGTKASASR